MSEFKKFDEELWDYKQLWDFGKEHKQSGKKLPLLTLAELIEYENLLKKSLSFSNFYDNNHKVKGQYLSIIYSHKHSIEKLQSLLLKMNPAWKIHGKKVSSNSSVSFYIHDLKAINDDINSYFSAEGWRVVRAEMAQINKRKKVKRVPLNTTTIDKLNTLKDAENYSSYDECVVHLLSEYQQQNHSVQGSKMDDSFVAMLASQKLLELKSFITNPDEDDEKMRLDVTTSYIQLTQLIEFAHLTDSGLSKLSRDNLLDIESEMNGLCRTFSWLFGVNAGH